MPGRLIAERFDIRCILADLTRPGASAIPCLREEHRRALLREARRCRYRPGAEVIGSGQRVVRQQLAIAEEMPAGGPFHALRDEFQSFLASLLSELEVYPFESPLGFDELVLQRYEPGSIGITPHRDRMSYVNLVCLFNLEGRARFWITQDRAGRAPQPIDASPGNVILMRAPGFKAAGGRPFHCVGDIEERRYVLGLRQVRSEKQPGAGR
jgi:hypothetical protein